MRNDDKRSIRASLHVSRLVRLMGWNSTMARAPDTPQEFVAMIRTQICLKGRAIRGIGMPMN
jgi:hypothetical protein